MSVETSIDNLISTLKFLSNSYRGSASALVQQADDHLSALKPPPPGHLAYAVEREEPDLTRIPQPPTITGLKELVLPELGDFQELNDLNERFHGDVPSLTIPAFSYSSLPTAPTFTAAAPEIEPLTIAPVLPTLNEPAAPTLTRPREVSAPSISGTPPPIPRPVFSPFVGDFHAEYLHGLGLTASDLTEWATRLRALFLPVETLLIQRLQAALRGTEPGLPDTWETGKYQQVQQSIFAERYDALGSLDDQPSSVTGLPTGSSVYRRLQLELKTLQAATQAASKVTNDRHEREVKHLQWAVELAAKLADAAMALQAQVAGWRMKGLLLALEGAEGTLNLALKVLAFKTKEIEFLVRYNEAQVRRTEDRLKIEKSQLETLKLDVASNQLTATYNDQQANLYQIAGSWIENRIKLYQAQIQYLTLDADWQKLTLQAFESQIQVYQATVKAKGTEYDALKAQIKGDLALTEAELAKVRVYEAELTQASVEAQAQAAKVQSQAATNKQALDAYNTEVSAQLSYLRMLDQATRTALSAIVKGFDAEVAEQELALKDQALKDQEALYLAMRELEYERTDLTTQLSQYQVLLAQRAAQSRVIDGGASTLGSIATQAYAGLNAVGARDILESA